jgi:hypothetical protein
MKEHLEIHRYQCDHCARKADVSSNSDALPSGWMTVQLDDGAKHLCGEACLLGLFDKIVMQPWARVPAAREARDLYISFELGSKEK